VSFACGSILLWMVFSTLNRRLALPLPVSFAATLFLASMPPFAVWSTSGLETMPFALLLFVTFERLILRAKGPAPVAAGVAGLALALIRVEGIYWAVFMAPVAMISWTMSSRRRARPMLVYLGILLTGYAIYWIWRFTYYDSIIANTVYAKGHLSAASIRRGLKYVIVQYLSFIPLFLSLPGIFAALRRDRLGIGLPVAAMALAVVCYSVLVSGDFMAMARFLVPGLPFIAILSGWLLLDMYSGTSGRRIAVLAAAVLILVAGILPAWNVHPVPVSVRQRFHFRRNVHYYQSEYEQWLSQKNNAMDWEIIGRTLKEYAEPSESLVCGAIGAIGYYSELYIFDRAGLVDPNVGTRPIWLPLRSPGHDRRVPPEYFLDKAPSILFVKLISDATLKHIQSEYGKGGLTSWASPSEDFPVNLPALADDYVVDIVTVAGAEPDGGPFYLFVIRRIEEGVSPDVAWERAEQILESL
jgi:hypothetical protein